MIILNVYYQAKPGKRDAFYKAVQESGVAVASRQEEGNIKYDYYMAADDADTILLVEHWKDDAAFQFHIPVSYTHLPNAPMNCSIQV